MLFSPSFTLLNKLHYISQEVSLHNGSDREYLTSLKLLRFLVSYHL